VNPFFDELGRRLAAAASKRGAQIDPPKLDAALADELLELARVAAHTQERRFAPLASFMAGVAAERLRNAANASSSEQAELVREVRKQLEQQAESRA
jgi:hypothetical protein